MLTCPSCHHVLAAPSCCCGGLTMLPPTAAAATAVPTTPAATQPCAAAGVSVGPPRLQPFTHHHHHNGHQQLYNGHQQLYNGHQQLYNGHQQHLTPLATPHISGHMFHFPAMAGCSPLVCQPQVHSPCVMSCRSPALCGGEWRWPDSGSPAPPHHHHPALAARRHTSGGGLLDEVAKLGVGGVSGPGGCIIPNQGEDRSLATTRQALHQSGWYWERVSWREAETLLHQTSLGTFLVRDSADTRFIFSLSVQTERGPTSVRIHYGQGRFRLDCEAAVTTTMPEFPHLISLVEHYVRLNRKLQRHVWVDDKGLVFSPITVRQSLKHSVPSLKHLSRLAINLSCPRSPTALSLPPALSMYLTEYPFWC